MNNIDLNTITVAEAKAAGVTGMDLLTVLRNPVNSEVTKKNEEFAADLNAKTAKKIRVKAKTPKKKIATKLSWQFKNADKTTRLDKFFAGMTELLGDDFSTWYDNEDYKDAIATVMEAQSQWCNWMRTIMSSQSSTLLERHVIYLESKTQL